jgi:O-antigen ligase
VTIQIRYTEWLLAAFLAFILVRTMPFSPRGLVEIASDEASGDIVKQLTTIGFALTMGAIAVRLRGVAAFGFSLGLLVLIGFAALSLLWSAVPFIAGKRLALTSIVAASLLMSITQMRPRTVIDVLRTVTVGLALASLLAGIVYPYGAIHLSGDPEPSVVGAWRGVFFHKNLAGGVIGIAVLLSAEAFFRSRRWLWAAMLVLTAAALYLTRSSTSQISVVVALLMFFAIRGSNIIAASNATRALVLRATAVIAAVPLLIACWFLTPLHDQALDPEAFSGRGQLWDLIGRLIAERPLLGFGYQSVFQVGDAGPLVSRNLVEWMRHVPHSHNGVLDLLVTIGAVGSILFVWAMFVDPWRRLSNVPPALRDDWQPLFAALLSYAATHSLMEGKIFAADSIEWIILVLILGLSLRLKTIAAMIKPAPSQPITALWPDGADQS